MSDHDFSESEKVVSIVYTNHRGETSLRSIVPIRMWFGTTAWHLDPQWLLDARDLSKDEQRTFAVADIRVWLK